MAKQPHPTTKPARRIIGRTALRVDETRDGPMAPIPASAPAALPQREA